MTEFPWQTNGSEVQLTAGQFSARLDLANPGRGLQPVRAGDEAIAANLLRIDLAGAESCGAPAEIIVRGSDLIAVYEPTDPFPFRTQIRWRVLENRGRRAPRAVAALELMVSLGTDLLDSRPDVRIRSQLPARDFWYLADADEVKFQQFHLKTGAPRLFKPQTGPGCVMARLAGGKYSYTEMVSPTDFGGLVAERLFPQVAQLEHRPFSGPLEKGVILRVRFRACLLPRKKDALATSMWYDQLCQAPLPLATY